MSRTIKENIGKMWEIIRNQGNEYRIFILNCGPVHVERTRQTLANDRSGEVSNTLPKE